MRGKAAFWAGFLLCIIGVAVTVSVADDLTYRLLAGLLVVVGIAVAVVNLRA